VAEVKVESDVTGKVWQIEKKAGDSVGEDDAIIILESMKMEIPIAAPSAGKIVEILVAEGDPVEEGQEVAIMEV
jgi:acetyl-CoA carboxylase biotin carboxyl carrier protein